MKIDDDQGKGKDWRQIPGALACIIEREMCLGEDDCLTLRHAVSKVVSFNQVKMSHRFMDGFAELSPMQMEEKPWAWTICHAVIGAFYTLGAIGTSECWGSANSGERKETKELSTIQPSRKAVLMFSPGKQALHLTLLLFSGRKYEQKIRGPTSPLPSQTDLTQVSFSPPP